MKEEVEAAGLNVSGIESVNIHDAIKTRSAGQRPCTLPTILRHLENLGKAGYSSCML